MNRETLTNNLVILLKDVMGLSKDEKFWCYGGSLKNLNIHGASQKPIYSKKLPKKQACTIYRFNLRKDTWQKIGRVVLLKGGTDTPMHTMI